VGTMVTFPTASGDGQGMLAVPPAPGPGMLLLPDFRGLAPDTVAAAQRRARAGGPSAPHIPARQLWGADGIHLHGFTGTHVLLHLADATSFGLADAQRLRGVEIFTYPGTRHGFLADIRPDLFDAAAASLVWERTKTVARLAAAPSSAPAADG
jgi:dienelactone hydrolase